MKKLKCLIYFAIFSINWNLKIDSPARGMLVKGYTVQRCWPISRSSMVTLIIALRFFVD